jgi:hypothetical protein
MDFTHAALLTLEKQDNLDTSAIPEGFAGAGDIFATHKKQIKMY